MPMPKHCIQFIRFIALINCTHTRWPCTRSTGYRRGKAAAGSAPACSRGPSRRCCCTPRTDRAQAAARVGWGLGRGRRRCTIPAPPPTCSSGSAMLCEHRHSSHTGKHQRPSQRHRAAVGLVCRSGCCTMLGSESGCSQPCVEAAGGSQRSWRTGRAPASVMRHRQQTAHCSMQRLVLAMAAATAAVAVMVAPVQPRLGSTW